MRMRRARSLALATLVVAAACSDAPPPGADDGSSASGATQDPPAAVVRPGRATWSAGYFQAGIFSALLEELDYTVESPALHEYPVDEAYLAMASGEFDFWPNGWFSQHRTYFERELDDGTTVGDHVAIHGQEVPNGGLEGLLITKSVADEYGIASLDQINSDPELLDLFDADGNGRAEVHGCPDSWTCDDIIQEMMDLNGWSNLEQVTAEYEGLIATSIERVRRGEPVIQYTWSPSGYLAEIVPGEDVYWLSVGGQEHVLDGSTPGEFDFSHAPAAPLGDRCSADPCWLGWEVADIQVTANTAFTAANPAAATLFDVVELPYDDITAQHLRFLNGENTEADIERHADEWIAANRATVDEWLTTARAVAGG